MKLRPHHLLCIQKYTGHGYSPEFTEHMDNLTAKLKKEPDTQIIIAEGCDELCRKCPKKSGGSCTSTDQVGLLDNEVLKACAFSYGERAFWQDAARKARERVFETERFDRICIHCHWYELCRETETDHEYE